ncbi:D-glycero-alpha-D-manno-heptose-1,7-bisphosphate 7-phosphatase [Kordiimonas pumila]|uniref:D,D-heptose 1,7-bisphosphate phosphatase n=1 Tax=Kordiimonas pumila TaxID=2161677 RepID=A0ABV7D935_9PROT|nr:HAD family hydrolase [Kordiimonas pumila]
MNRAVFLDRDGVLNRAFVRGGKSYPPATLHEFELLEGVAEACSALKSAGFKLIVVTNQPDVATGKQTRAVVEKMHAKLTALVPIDDIFVCYHVDADICACRKPAPGMILEAAKRHDIDLASSYLVGDRWRDIEAGVRAGCQAIFIEYGYAEKAAEGYVLATGSLKQASDFICNNEAGIK